MLRNTLNTFIAATLIMLLGVSSSASAQTIVPAGDLMGKTSVTFSGKDPEVVRRSGVVNVPLAPSAPEIKHIEGDESGEWIIEAGQDTARSITYAVKATANGPDTYTLTAEYDEATSENVDSPTLSWSAEDSSLELGATAAIGIADRAITVPYDKEGGLDSVNGIRAEETVVIGGTSYPVASVTNSPNSEDPTAGYPTATILLGGDNPPPTISVGTPITEQRTFTVTVSKVALAEEAEGTAGIKITATSVKDGLKKSERSFKFVVLAPVEPSFEKYVRNVTAPVTIEAGEGETTVHEGSTFYSQGVSATEGDELEYLIVLNAGNQEDQTSIDLVETLSPFVKSVSEESASLNYQGVSTPADIIAQSRAEVTLIRWMADVSTTSELPILKNTSAYLTYKVTVIGGVGDGGGDGDKPEIAKSYSGCLIQPPDPQKCVPDGTRWADLFDDHHLLLNGYLGAYPKAVRESVARQYTACWDGISLVDSHWVVGANGLDSADRDQDIYREAASNPGWSILAVMDTRSESYRSDLCVGVLSK